MNKIRLNNGEMPSQEYHVRLLGKFRKVSWLTYSLFNPYFNLKSLAK